VDDINSLVWVYRHVLAKQLDLAFGASHSRLWDIVLECLGYCTYEWSFTSCLVYVKI